MAGWRASIQPAAAIVAPAGHPDATGVRTREKVSTSLLTVLAGIALILLAGLFVIGLQLASVQNEISELRDRSMPRLVKLSQLSQESSASIAIAPALSTNPSRFEFETLLSRLEDKKGSQKKLLAELRDLISNEDAANTLQHNSGLLAENQNALTHVVRQQIDVRRRLEKHVERLRRFAREITKNSPVQDEPDPVQQKAIVVVLRVQGVLLDRKRARFSRSRREIKLEVEDLKRLVAQSGVSQPHESADNQASLAITPLTKVLEYWAAQGERLLDDKAAALANEFKIKALVEENSLIANRLLSSANAEFSRANQALTEQILVISSTTQFNLAAMFSVVLAFAAGSIFLWLTLQKRVFRRLDRMRDGLRRFADRRDHITPDDRPDEIGEISRALGDYMTKVDEQEGALANKTRDLESLSARLAKYLSPQVYESIFSGKQQVALSSSRKKLTVFFSDIVGFTQLADQVESEELTGFLNEYLTEMSQIALDHGATIDKYVGDSIMVFFGDPKTKGVKEDALACVNMAIAMRDRLASLNENWRNSGISKILSCRMGIHTGYCTVGNFGSEERMDYTIIGGTVNTASRLESAAKPDQILISYETFVLVSKTVVCRKQGQIDVKGIAYPVMTYSVLGQKRSDEERATSYRGSIAGLTLEIDREAMQPEDRRIALENLERAIQHLKSTQ